MENNQVYFNNKKLIDLSFFLIIALPISIITGPFIPDLIIVSLSLIFIIMYFRGVKFYFSNKIIIFLFIFWFYSVFCSLLSENIFLSLESSLFYGRFIFFSLLIGMVLYINPKLYNYYGYAFWIAVIIVLLDGYCQYIFKQNIFGVININQQRLNLFNTDEQILGSFLARVMPLCFIFFDHSKKRINKFVILIAITLIDILVYLSGERTAVVLVTVSTILIVICLPNLRFIRILATILAFLSILIINNINPTIKDRMIDSTLSQLSISNNEDKNFTYFSKEHERIYSASFKIYLENPIFGIGPKMYREKCKEIDYNPCTTHPHHFYIQLLLETGPLGFIMILLFFITLSYLCVKEIFKKYFYKSRILIDYRIFLLIICTFVNILPIVPHGNIYNNWLNSIMYLPLGIYIYLDIKAKESKKI